MGGEACCPAAGGRPEGVHPRVGGEAWPTMFQHLPNQGPSPRGRGSRMRMRNREPGTRSIPAWAGKPRFSGLSGSVSRVHPRVGGEAVSAEPLLAPITGPSPRGRGSPVRWHLGMGPRGSIPAWAGKPKSASVRSTLHRVHPRVGGEALWRGCYEETPAGPSPRGRGSPFESAFGSGGLGSIPAWAGKPHPRGRDRLPSRVHPRVGGEAHSADSASSSSSGPSPRGRGSRLHVDRARGLLRSIPAWAGKPTRRRPVWPAAQVHPRVGGEAGQVRLCAVDASGPSPRGRGSRQ